MQTSVFYTRSPDTRQCASPLLSDVPEQKRVHISSQENQYPNGLPRMDEEPQDSIVTGRQCQVEPGCLTKAGSIRGKTYKSYRFCWLFIGNFSSFSGILCQERMQSGKSFNSMYRENVEPQ